MKGLLRCVAYKDRLYCRPLCSLLDLGIESLDAFLEGRTVATESDDIYSMHYRHTNFKVLTFAHLAKWLYQCIMPCMGGMMLCA